MSSQQVSSPLGPASEQWGNRFKKDRIQSQTFGILVSHHSSRFSRHVSAGHPRQDFCCLLFHSGSYTPTRTVTMCSACCSIFATCCRATCHTAMSILSMCNENWSHFAANILVTKPKTHLIWVWHQGVYRVTTAHNIKKIRTEIHIVSVWSGRCSWYVWDVPWSELGTVSTQYAASLLMTNEAQRKELQLNVPSMHVWGVPFSSQVFCM